jgi:hypothetical protein
MSHLTLSQYVRACVWQPLTQPVHTAIDGLESRDCRLDGKSIDRSQLVLAWFRFSRMNPLDVDRMMLRVVDLVLVVSV